MKKILLPLCLLATLFADAQTKEGKVVYERTIKIRRPQNLDVDPGTRIPDSRTDNYELLFGNEQSVWRALPRTDGDQGTIGTSTGSNGEVRTFRMMTNLNDVTYFNFNTGKRLDKREQFDREYLVEDTIAKMAWKLTGESKDILGHKAMKATAQRIGTRMQMSMENGQMKREEVQDTSYVIAWFSTDFPVKAGPAEYQGQLPGLVLELDINNGRTTFKAVELSPKVTLASIKEPKGGKRLSSAEFITERNKLMDEMRRNMPQGGNMRIFQQ